VFENRVLKRIFGPRKDEMMGEWRELQNEELRDFYTSPSIIRTVKSRWMRWAGNIARMGKRRRRTNMLLVLRRGKETTRKKKT
jgi:hypothetical protein